MAGDLSSERTRSRELAEKIARRDPLDVNKVIYKDPLCSFSDRNICKTFTRNLIRIRHYENFDCYGGERVLPYMG